jgi:hypothetical protein
VGPPSAPTSVTGSVSGTTSTVNVEAEGGTASFDATLSLPRGSWHLQGTQPSRDYAEVPHPGDLAAITWTIPNGGA